MMIVSEPTEVTVRIITVIGDVPSKARATEIALGDMRHLEQNPNEWREAGAHQDGEDWIVSLSRLPEAYYENPAARERATGPGVP